MNDIVKSALTWGIAITALAWGGAATVNLFDDDPSLIRAKAGRFQYINNDTSPSTYDVLGGRCS